MPDERAPQPRDEFEARLRGMERFYHIHHPFHLAMNEGGLDAEAVRGWVANLAQPPLDTEAELVQAIARGECGVGIASSGATVGTRLQVNSPETAYVDIEAIGVTRHAANPDAAIRLIDWLVSPDRLRRHAEQTGLLPVANDTVARDNAVLAASGAVEASKLAERARYR